MNRTRLISLAGLLALAACNASSPVSGEGHASHAAAPAAPAAPASAEPQAGHGTGEHAGRSEIKTLITHTRYQCPLAHAGARFAGKRFKNHEVSP